MEERKDFLTRLKEHFGSCDRKSFLQELRDFFSSPAQQTKHDEPNQELEVSQPEVEGRIIDINGADIGRNLVDFLKESFRSGCHVWRNPVDCLKYESFSDFIHDEPNQEPEVSQPEVEVSQSEVEGRIIDINGTDAWRDHVDRLKDVSLLSNYISNYISKSKILLKGASMAPFAKSVTTSLAEIPVYVDKHFKEPRDIDDDTSEKVAEQTGKFVKECIWDLLRGCHGGMKHSQDAEKKFYENFCERLEGYLSSVGVYRKNITVGMDVRKNAKWFEKTFKKESSTASRIGIIDEIEVAPHFIPYRDEDGCRAELILRGVCIYFGDTKRK